MTGVSAACTTALLGAVSCDDYLKKIANSDWYGAFSNVTYQKILCDPKCGQSLASYRAAVVKACAGSPPPQKGRPAVYWVDSITSAYNLTCLTDTKTGGFCSSKSIPAPKVIVLISQPTWPKISPTRRMRFHCRQPRFAIIVLLACSDRSKALPILTTVSAWPATGRPYRKFAISLTRPASQS